MKTFSISPSVLAQAVDLGIYGRTAEARMKQMARLAIPCGSSQGMFRFQQYIMHIELGGLVTKVEIQKD